MTQEKPSFISQIENAIAEKKKQAVGKEEQLDGRIRDRLESLRDTLGDGWEVEPLVVERIPTTVSDPINLPDYKELNDSISPGFEGFSLNNRRLRKYIVAGFTGSGGEWRLGASYASSFSGAEPDRGIDEAINSLRSVNEEIPFPYRLFPSTAEIVTGKKLDYSEHVRKSPLAAAMIVGPWIEAGLVRIFDRNPLVDELIEQGDRRIQVLQSMEERVRERVTGERRFGRKNLPEPLPFSKLGLGVYYFRLSSSLATVELPRKVVEERIVPIGIGRPPAMPRSLTHPFANTFDIGFIPPGEED